MRASRTLPATLLLAVFAITACGKKAPVVAPAPAPAPVDTSALHQQHLDSIAAAERARQAAEDAAARARADSIAQAQAQAEAATQAAMRASLTAMIHFDFNKSDLRADAQALLDSKIPILLANPGVMIRIAGNTDERGSTEYNLALGQRRAATAKKYLTDHGVSASSIETVSYGEERPIAQGHTEDAWQQNRRDEFDITGGAAGQLNHPAGM